MVIRKKILVLPVYAISRYVFGCHMKPSECMINLYPAICSLLIIMSLTHFIGADIFLFGDLFLNLFYLHFNFAGVIEIAIVDVLNLKLADNRIQTVPLFFIKPAKCSFPSWIDESATIIKAGRTHAADAKDNIKNEGLTLTPSSLNIRQFLFALLKSDIMGFKQPK